MICPDPLKDKILISFVIPVYNVQTYIDECINSILLQSAPEIEIILVDDGSTDFSGKICDTFAEKYKTIRVLHQENMGLAAARNAGLTYAKGKYISFIDSDDRLADKCVDDILKWISSTDVDICFMQAIKFWDENFEKDLGEKIEKKYVENRTPEEVMHYLSTRPKFTGSACTKLYRRIFLLDNKLTFPDDKRLSEDLGFVLDCLLAADKFDVLEMPFYEYRQKRMGSITSTISFESLQGILLFISESIDKLMLNGKPVDALRKSALSFVAYEYSILLMHYNKTSFSEYEFMAELKKYQWVLKYGKSIKLKIVRNIVNLFGIDRAAKLLDSLYHAVN